MVKENYYIGIDVGSGSVRAGLFSSKGKMLIQASFPIDIYKPKTDYVEQSSDNIWTQTCKAVKSLIEDSRIDYQSINGIAFDATCSLVVLDGNNEPLSVSSTGKNSHNIIMWMDHRAVEQAAIINRTGNEALKYVGGKVNPEMEIPKILWLKENMPEQYGKAHRFLDLADYLSFKATGKTDRSVCTMVCKWIYLAHINSWSEPLFREIGLEDFLTSGKIEGEIRNIGEYIGGLTPEAADDLGLKSGTSVAVGVIDAHAGAIGLLGEDADTTIAVIGGTSSCLMAITPEPIFVPGVWGPYYRALGPELWLAEGGLSAAGALIDHVIKDNGYYPELKAEADNRSITVYQVLNENLADLEQLGELNRRFHMLGYHHGNRSPRANPELRGMISGLSLNINKEELVHLYFASIQSVALGTRHIIDVMNDNGYNISRLKMCGGGTKNPIWLREHADITGCQVSLPDEPEAVLLGSAILAATGASEYSSVREAMSAMTKTGEVINPDPSRKDFLDKKYAVFQEMYADQLKYEGMME